LNGHSPDENKQENKTFGWFQSSQPIVTELSQEVKDFYANMQLFNEFYFGKVQKEIIN